MGCRSVLFITRKFPPDVGGMERVAFGLSQALAKLVPVKLVKPPHGKSKLSQYVFTLLRGAWLILRSPTGTVVLLQDAALSPLVAVAKLRLLKVAVIAHGLDITLPSRLYQLLVLPPLRGAAQVICISEKTKAEVLRQSVPLDRIVIIPNGVAPLGAEDAWLGQRQPFILTVGRQVQRKGYLWFLEHVAPRILAERPNLRIKFAGDGPLHEEMRRLAAASGTEDQIDFLRGLRDDQIWSLMCQCSVFFMPNVEVPGDMEGFGVVAVEAMTAGAPVVVADLEGLRQAVPSERVGIRVKPGDADAFQQALERVLNDERLAQSLRLNARQYVRDELDWNHIAARYVDELGLIAERG